MKAFKRLRPVSGTNFTFSIAASARSLISETSANHCAVARVMTGFFVRQSIGFLCVNLCATRRRPVSAYRLPESPKISSTFCAPSFSAKRPVRDGD